MPWLKAVLISEVSLQITENCAKESDANLRRLYEDHLRRSLAHRAIDSLLTDRLSITLSLDGLETRVN